MKKLLLLLIFLAPYTQGAIIKASMEMYISDYTRPDAVGEVGSGYLIFDTDESVLLGFHAESAHYSFSMMGPPMIIYWDAHLYPEDEYVYYAYGSWGGKAKIQRGSGVDELNCLFGFAGEAATDQIKDIFAVMFEHGDGLMSFQIASQSNSPAPEFEISLDIPSSDITVLEPASVPEPSSLALLTFALAGIRLTTRSALRKQ